MLAQEVIRRKRDGHALSDAQIDDFVLGLVDGRWSEAQAASLAMAICLRGMNDDETVALTEAMTSSGERLAWGGAEAHGPVLDKHSTGGVGDKVSLLLAPIVAACGGIVPMVSGRGLGHTGGTLDKLDSIPGYQSEVPLTRLRSTLHEAGCAIVGQTAELAPADRRLYAIRGVTATVESVPLITASILSKKLAAGLDALVLDVKFGNGAFATDLEGARTLAQTLVRVARHAGLPAYAWITDMNQVLGTTCGHALEVLEVLQVLQGHAGNERLLELTQQLATELLMAGGLADTVEQAQQRIDDAVSSGRALERFARMVAALGGPVDFVERAAQHLPAATVQHAVTARRAGFVTGMSTRDIGLLLIALGGGRRRAQDRIDPSAGLSELTFIGQAVRPGDTLAVVHAESDAAAEAAGARLQQLIEIGDDDPGPQPVLLHRI